MLRANNALDAEMMRQETAPITAICMCEMTILLAVSAPSSKANEIELDFWGKVDFSMSNLDLIVK